MVQLHIEPYRRNLLIGALKLVLVDGDKARGDQYLDRVSDIITVLNHRSSINRKYMFVTCINPYSVEANLIVMCNSNDEVLKELDTICALVETLGQGEIKCLVRDDPLTLLNECLGLQSPINYLIKILKRGKEETSVQLHALSVNPSYNINSVEEYEYLSSIFSHGTISLGHLYSNSKIIVTLNNDHIFRHIAIVGSTGSGKSTTASIIAEKSAENGYAVVVLDWHGEYKELIQSKNNMVYTNPLSGTILETLSFEELIKKEPLSFLEILESALELTPPQAHILEDAINIISRRTTSSSYYIDEIIDVVQNSSASARWFTESREALLRKLKPLSSDYLKIYWNKLKKIVIDREKIYVFDISHIPNTRVKRVLSSLLIRSIVIKAQYNNIVKPILIIVDEAHNVLYSGNPVSNLVAEVRKWNIGFVTITQAPSMLSSVVLKNTNTKIIHSLKSSSDVKTVLSVIPLRKEHKKMISALKPGEALVVLPELAEPILVKIVRV
ncbi:MAG: ATP-binding protein [Ignisphaera sp.]|uniref:ATP-binding protein n=1 Tax=Ignisphaera aggregans TaxID=334771 RepID=A0A7J3MYT5_9CREN